MLICIERWSNLHVRNTSNVVYTQLHRSNVDDQLNSNMCAHTHSPMCAAASHPHYTYSCDARIMSNLGYMICVCYVLKTTIYVMGMALEYIRARAYIPTRVLSSGLNSKCVSEHASYVYWKCMLETIHILKKNLRCKWQWKGFDFSFHISSRLFYYDKPIKLTFWFMQICRNLELGRLFSHLKLKLMVK